MRAFSTSSARAKQFIARNQDNAIWFATVAKETGKFFDQLLVAKLHEWQSYPFAIRCRKFIATQVLSSTAR